MEFVVYLGSLSVMIEGSANVILFVIHFSTYSSANHINHQFIITELFQLKEDLQLLIPRLYEFITY